MGAAENDEVQARVTVRSVDPDKSEVVIVPEDGTGETHIVVEKAYAAKIKAGDRLLVTYESRSVNVPRGC